MTKVYVIPVPDGMSVQDAFDEIMFCGELLEGRTVSPEGDGGTWATIAVFEADPGF